MLTFLFYSDSKKLTEKQRESIFKEINAAHGKEIGYFVDVLGAEMLSNNMLSDWDKGGRNLNKISHDSAIGLIKKVQSIGFVVRRCYLDAVGNNDKYKSLIARALNDDSIEIVVESKADDTFPVVSAASICAKVTRDHALNDFLYPEKGKEFSRKVGCGYPGDKVTRGWLKDHIDPTFGFPSIVRFSWKTCYEWLEKEGYRANFLDIPESVADGTNKAEIKKLDHLRSQKEQEERTRLSEAQKKRRMNVAVHRLNLVSNFEEF